MGLKEELIEALNDLELENPTIELEKTPSGKIGGVIVSKSFKGKSQLDRQNLVWNRLEEILGKKKLVKVVALLTLTPQEADGAYSKA